MPRQLQQAGPQQDFGFTGFTARMKALMNLPSDLRRDGVEYRQKLADAGFEQIELSRLASIATRMRVTFLRQEN